jgi:short subunit dehydrogenase-like uncharacterized protein
MSDREFDVVVFGATGFVGRLTAGYLAEHAPVGLRVALAGRSEAKLDEIRQGLPAAAHDWALVVADAGSPPSLQAMAARTRVVCTTVGPYLRYGQPLVAACVAAGTDYLDLTGEVPFVRRSIDEYHGAAEANGTRIVHACGFDSIPSDLSTYLLHRQVVADGAGTMRGTTLVVRAARGALSGGTIDSVRVLSELASDGDMRRVLANPHALSADTVARRVDGRSSEANDFAIVAGRSVDPSLSGTLAPFFMSSFNTRIVRRSNALLDDAYGPHFRYREALNVGRRRGVSTAAAAAVAVGTLGFMGLMALAPTRRLLDRVLPKPGTGPSAEAREKGFFITDTYTQTTTGARYRLEIRAQGDPGYRATATMLGEAAITLASCRDELPDRAGVLTPAVAFGDVLVDRLRKAGMTFEVSQTS